MADKIQDLTAAGTAHENIPTNSQPMDNIHGNVEVGSIISLADIFKHQQ